VVDPFDVIAQELEDPADGVALNSGPQMAYVHVLGDVWAGEVDQDRFLWL